jgi:hypothetical protein
LTAWKRWRCPRTSPPHCQGPLREVWDGWPRSVRRGALEILLNAKRPDTRVAKVAAIVAAAESGTRPFQWSKA